MSKVVDLIEKKNNFQFSLSQNNSTTTGVGIELATSSKVVHCASAPPLLKLLWYEISGRHKLQDRYISFWISFWN